MKMLRYMKRETVLAGPLVCLCGKTKGILGCPDLREDLRRTMIGKHNLARRLYDISYNKVGAVGSFYTGAAPYNVWILENFHLCQKDGVWR